MTVRGRLVAPAATAVLAATAAGDARAASPLRTGEATDGTSFRLRGRVLVVRLDRDLGRGTRVFAMCGRQGGAARRKKGKALRRFRPDARRLGFRLHRDVAADAEWCHVRASAPGTRPWDATYEAAVALEPVLAPAPEPLVSGPGVREAVTREDDLSGAAGEATFLIAGSVVTVRLREPWGTSRRLARERRLNRESPAVPRRDHLAFLGCFPHRGAPPAYRVVVVPSGARTVTADLGADISGGEVECLLENTVDGEEIAARF